MAKVKSITKVNKLVVEEKLVNIGSNPLAVGIEIPVVPVYSKDTYKKDEDAIVPITIFIEKTPFTKVYNTSENRKIVNNLSSRAKTLLLWIIYEVEAGKDYLWINKSRYMQEVGIKAINTYNEAIKELIRYGLIKDTKAVDTFWINPEFIFNGNRVKKYPKNVIKHESRPS